MKISLIVLLFVVTVCVSYYSAVTTHLDGEGGLKGLETYFLILQVSAITAFLLVGMMLVLSKINTNRFSIAGLIFSGIGACFAIYLWRANGHQPPYIRTDYGKFAAIFLPSILFVIISQAFSYFYFYKQKTSQQI
jgi:hypothetical protein